MLLPAANIQILCGNQLVEHFIPGWCYPLTSNFCSVVLRLQQFLWWLLLQWFKTLSTPDPWQTSGLLPEMISNSSFVPIPRLTFRANDQQGASLVGSSYCNSVRSCLKDLDICWPNVLETVFAVVAHAALFCSGPYILVERDMIFVAAVNRLNKKRKI